MSGLHEFLQQSCIRGCDGIDVVQPCPGVTALMYFYWKVEDAFARWPAFEGALLETWRNCGLLKTVIVSNAQHACIMEFSRRFDNVQVQVEESLVPGSLRAMSIDCDLRLYTRFDTDYVLIVQNDGFPLRRGLDGFVGKYDYIGAPWVAHTTYYDLYPYPKFSVGNGGFSLRSRRLCQAASMCYQKWFSKLPFWWYMVGDDTFYCKTLRFWLPSIRRKFKWASAAEASSFSVEHNVDFLGKNELPFGFHAEIGFKNAFSQLRTMMVSRIKTLRRTRENASFSIVYEWEDVLAQELSLPFVDDIKVAFWYKLIRKLAPRAATWCKTKDSCLMFDMSAHYRDRGDNKPNLVPCVIDFFQRSQKDLATFYRNYRRNRLVLISSREAYEYLKSKGCPLNIRHWALSIADKWVAKLDCPAEKRYDVALVGRTNPVLKGFLDRYSTEHPTLRCALRVCQGGKFVYRDSQTGEIFSGDNRDDYMRIVRLSRIGLYSTPGMDGANPAANGFNQVTPRFLEYLAGGCHVLARYPKNPDTDYYELSSFSPSIETYEQFAAAMERCLSTGVDLKKYKAYLRKHVTSARAAELKRILEEEVA